MSFLQAANDTAWIKYAVQMWAALEPAARKAALDGLHGAGTQVYAGF